MKFYLKGRVIRRMNWSLMKIFSWVASRPYNGGEFANDTKQVYKVPSGLTESNQRKQAHFIYATVTGNKTKILAEPKRESQVLYEVSNEMVKAWFRKSAEWWIYKNIDN